MAYLIVGVTDEVITQTALTPLSVGLILFPIVCNLGELIAAFRGAWHNDMDAAMNVAAGSSVQVPLFVTPVLVFISAILAGRRCGQCADPGLQPGCVDRRGIGDVRLCAGQFGRRNHLAGGRAVAGVLPDDRRHCLRPSRTIATSARQILRYPSHWWEGYLCLRCPLRAVRLDDALVVT